MRHKRLFKALNYNLLSRQSLCPSLTHNGFEKFDVGFVAAKSTKGLPAWIIDHMKKNER